MIFDQGAWFIGVLFILLQRSASLFQKRLRNDRKRKNTFQIWNLCSAVRFINRTPWSTRCILVQVHIPPRKIGFSLSLRTLNYYVIIILKYFSCVSMSMYFFVISLGNAAVHHTQQPLNVHVRVAAGQETCSASSHGLFPAVFSHSALLLPEKGAQGEFLHVKRMNLFCLHDSTVSRRQRSPV